MKVSWSLTSTMSDRPTVVINTGPLLALIAATGGLDLLRTVFSRVVVPHEVFAELTATPVRGFGQDVVHACTWLEVRSTPVKLPELLGNTLDVGEAAVIQTALDESIPLVCIDEVAGRRVARLSGLEVTGSLGVLLRAKALGYEVDPEMALQRMRENGIWLSERLRREFRALAGLE
jgi:predicted nucleic acid-binding protein